MPTARPAPVVERLRALVAEQPDGDQEAADAYEELWGLIVGGADNLAYQLALNSLLTASASFDLRERSLPEARDREAQAELVAAIERGDGDAAESLARDLLERTPWSM